MSLKCYTDTHIDKQVAIQLRARGVEVIRCEEVGMADAADEEHLIYATQKGYAVITVDKGFSDRAYRWLADGREHGGLFLVHDNLQGKRGIGFIVMNCFFYFEALEAGATTIDEIQNHVIHIKE